MYNFKHTVNFATRTRNDSIKSSESPIINGVSDHDAQHLMINNVVPADKVMSLKQRRRK
jgi:hypothetical protein